MHNKTRKGTNLNSTTTSSFFNNPYPKSINAKTVSHKQRKVIRANAAKWVNKSRMKLSGFTSFQIWSHPKDPAQKWVSRAPPL